MYGRAGLDRFRKAQTLEPFSVTVNAASKTTAPSTAPISVVNPPPFQHPPSQNPHPHTRYQPQQYASQNSVGQEALPRMGQNQQVTQAGGGQSTWQPPDWAIEPRSGVYYLEVLKDGEVLDRINLDKRRQIFGRQFHTCDFVLDHQSVSRQHAAVVPHKNGSIYVIDLGSAHGTFVANERLIKDTPVELEVGQSLRFAASTRTYILRKNNAALFPRPPSTTEIDLPPPPDPSDEEAVVAYNTLLNRYGLNKADLICRSSDSVKQSGRQEESKQPERASKRMRSLRVTFRDQVGGELVEVVGISDGVDVETEPGPIGMKEGSFVGKYESLVQTTVIPKGKEQAAKKQGNAIDKGVTDKLKEVFDKVKSVPKGGIYDDLDGESFSGQVGSSWAYSSVVSADRPAYSDKEAPGKDLSSKNSNNNNDDDEDLFGD